MEFNDVVIARRTVRRFRPEPVPEAVIADIINTGRLAASGHFAQQWRFGVVTEADLKEKLADLCGNQSWMTTAPVIFALCLEATHEPDDEATRQVYRDRFGRRLMDYIEAYPDRKAMNLLKRTGEALLPGQQMFLAAANHGLRGCFIGWLDIARVNALLKLPDNLHCLFLLCVGFPYGEPDEAIHRPLSEVAFSNRWGRPWQGPSEASQESEVSTPASQR